MRATLTLASAFLLLGLGVGPAHAVCKRFGFTVNDYGKEGPIRDAKDLLDKHIAKAMSEQGITEYQTGKKDVSCELFLNFVLFDEHTCTASANVCWNDGQGGATLEAADSGTGVPPTPVRKVVAQRAAGAHEAATAKPAAAAPPAAAPAATPPSETTTAAPAVPVEKAAAESVPAAGTAHDAGSAAQPSAPAATLEKPAAPAGSASEVVETGALAGESSTPPPAKAAPAPAAEPAAAATPKDKASTAAAAAAAAAERAAAAAETAAAAAKEAAAAAVAASAASRGAFVPPLDLGPATEKPKAAHAGTPGDQ
jgi:hypothetical protein